MQNRTMQAGSRDGQESGPTWVDEVHSYLVWRGLGAEQEDHGRLLRRLLEIAGTRHSTGFSVNAAAKNLYVSRRTLGRHCKVAGLPQPSRVLKIGRVLNVVELVCKNGCSVHAAAQATNWSDAFSLSNAMLRLTGLRPGAARTLGILNVVELWLKREIVAGRAALRSPRHTAISCPSCGRDIEASRDASEASVHGSTFVPSIIPNQLIA